MDERNLPERLDTTEMDWGRKERPRWVLVVGYAVTIALWIAASTLHPTIFVAGLVWALVIRGVYVAFRRRRSREHPFWSPWLFALAAVCSAASFAGWQQRNNAETDKAAVSLGVAKPSSEVSPQQRCVTKILEDAADLPPAQLALVPGGVNEFAAKYCASADRKGALETSGDVFASKAFSKSVCVEGGMAEFDRVPRNQRAFSRADFRVFITRYCSAGIDRGLLKDARTGKHRKELLALQQEILDQLERSGRIHRLR